MIRTHHQEPGADLIATERQRQLDAEGWTPEHDDGWTEGQLALAAACYATPIPLYRMRDGLAGPSVVFADPWPWQDAEDKRKRGGNVARVRSEDRLTLLVKAGALIAAEIDRLQRASGETQE